MIASKAPRSGLESDRPTAAAPLASSASARRRQGEPSAPPAERAADNAKPSSKSAPAANGTKAQLALFRTGPSARTLASTADKLSALLGGDRVGSPGTANDPRPDRFALLPFEPPELSKAPPKPRHGRGSTLPEGCLAIRALRPPVALEVLTVDDSEDEDPAPASTAGPYGGAFRAPSTARPDFLKTRAQTDDQRLAIHGQVRVASGPWSVEESWWSARPVGRDYWDVELAAGALYRIYRDRDSGAWFADGVYD